MKIDIRQERESDHAAVALLIEAAFREAEESEHAEHILVERLRTEATFVPELSLVAEGDGDLVGHILLTPVQIVNTWQSFPSLSLAPVSVAPQYQKQGIGGKLIEAAHAAARDLGYLSVILLGHPGYYYRFGYKKCSQFGIELPFEAPAEACMALELQKGGLKGVSGIVQYPKAFFE